MGQVELMSKRSTGGLLFKKIVSQYYPYTRYTRLEFYVKHASYGWVQNFVPAAEENYHMFFYFCLKLIKTTIRDIWHFVDTGTIFS